MSVYRDVGQAVARVFSIETVDGTAKALWQDQYQSGWPELREKGSGLSSGERLAQDSMTRAALHRELPEICWHVLTAKFSINDHEVGESIRWLVPRIVSPAHHLFKMKCVSAWAIPKKRGTEGAKTSRRGLPESFYELHAWDSNGTPEGTLRRWRAVTKNWLDDQVADAFNRANVILHSEGVLIIDAA